MQPSPVLRLVTLVALSPLTACSYIFMQSPPPHVERGDSLSCTSSNAAPVVDTIAAVGQGAGALLFALMLEGLVSVPQKTCTLRGPSPVITFDVQCGPILSDTELRLALGSNLIGAAISSISAAHGYSSVKHCKEAKIVAGPQRSREMDPIDPLGRRVLVDSSSPQALPGARRIEQRTVQPAEIRVGKKSRAQREPPSVDLHPQVTRTTGTSTTTVTVIPPK